MAADTLRISVAGETHVCRDGSTTTIGSSPDADIRVDHPGISRVHAQVLRRNGVWLLEDASSTNGTFHGGSRIEQLEIDGVETVLLGHPDEGVSIDLAPEAATPAPRSIPERGVSATSRTSAVSAETGAPAAPNTASWLRQLVWAVWALAGSILVLAIVVAIVAAS